MEYYYALSTYYKSVKGAVNNNETITFRVDNIDSVVFVCINDKTNSTERVLMKKNDNGCECSVRFDVGLYWYYFELPNGQFLTEENLHGVISNSLEKKFQLLVYDNSFLTPEWFKGGIIYQIFPDRFYRTKVLTSKNKNCVIHQNLNDIPYFLPDENGKIKNNDFFGGNLEGITEKLDYLNNLGVTVIYLNPIFEAYSNHRYDTGDYLKIDPLLGDENDLKKLIEKATNYGIKIILDGVFNHTGDDSIYFNKYNNYKSVGAFQDKNSPYFSWYNFVRFPDLYQSWWGVDVLPTTNKNDKNFCDFITGINGVIQKYTKLGIGGWRLDVVDELPDDFVKKIRVATKSTNKDAIVIGEVWEDASNKISYGVRRDYFQGKELDSVMNYPLKNAILDFAITEKSDFLIQVINEQLDHYPKIVLDCLMNILSTHDTFRLLSALSDIDVSNMSKIEMSNTVLQGEMLKECINRLKVAVLLQYTLYGVPSIYYGDEIGMQGFKDPLNRKFFEWNNINYEIQNYYIKLAKIRKSFLCFKVGETEILYSNNGCVIYKRTCPEDEVLVAINNSNEEYFMYFEGVLTDLLNNVTYINKLKLESKTNYILINKT